MSSLRVCPSCGNSSFSETPPVRKEADTHRQASPTVSVDEAKEPAALTALRTSVEAKFQADSKELVGVGGWLGFFVIVQVFIQPIFVGAQLVGLIKILQSAPDSDLKNWLTFVSCTLGLFVIFGLFVGIQIWKIKQDAIKHAKLYLKIAIAFNIFWGLFFIYKFEDGSLASIMLTVIVSIIWHIYMDKSSRVRKTFG